MLELNILWIQDERLVPCYFVEPTGLSVEVCTALRSVSQDRACPMRVHTLIKKVGEERGSAEK